MAASLPEQQPSTMILLTDQLGQIEVKPIKAFEPFTKGQVLLVEVETAALPTTAILKVFDPKYINERRCGSKVYEWTAKAEMDAMQQRGTGAYEHWIQLDDYDEDSEQAAAMEEEGLALLMSKSYESEKGAYQALRPMQGRHIPRLYAYGTVQTEPARALNPFFVLIEYVVNAVKLSDIKEPLSSDVQKVAADLCSAVDQFASLGVIHTDINRNNILVCPDRVVLIDFGCAGVRSLFDYVDMTEEEQQEEWELGVAQNQDSRWIRHEFGVPT